MSKTMKMIIKGGRLYEYTYEGQFIQLPLEFGNLEQIQFIRNYEKKMMKYRNGLHIDPDYEVKATAIVDCMCGSTLSKTKEVEDMEDVTQFEDEVLICKRCGNKFQLNTDKYYTLYAYLK